MTLFGIAWRSIRQRLLTSGLTALSLALGCVDTAGKAVCTYRGTDVVMPDLPARDCTLSGTASVAATSAIDRGILFGNETATP